MRIRIRISIIGELIRIVGMAQEKGNKELKQKKVGRPRKDNLKKVEELKLGRFMECEPLLLPEKETKRGWQLLGGVLLLMGAVVGLMLLVLLVWGEELLGDGAPVMAWQARLASGGLYLEVTAVMSVVAVIMSAVAGVMLLAKKRVPVGVWYVLVAAVVAGLICASFRTFRWFEERQCYENYPGIYPEDPNKGSGCPSVVGDLSLIVIKDLIIYTVGIIVLYMVHRADKLRLKRPKQKKH